MYNTLIYGSLVRVKLTVDNKLSFLDCMIKGNEGPLSTTVFRKSTFTGALLNFYANCPTIWKRSLIKCLLYRAYRICSSPDLFKTQVCILRKIFCDNAYPVSFFNNVLQRFENDVTRIHEQIESEDVTQADVLLCLRYIGNKSEMFTKKLVKFLKSHGVKLKTVFTVARIGDTFSTKSRTPFSLRSSVIYEFRCSVDPTVTYVGKTSRNLCERIKEHASIMGKSAISNHRLQCTCQCKKDSFKILKSCNNDFDLAIAETLFIKQKCPLLNRTLSNMGGGFLLNIFN